MPFIRGRYHINPIAGEALETARQLETALLERLQEESDGRREEEDSSSDSRGAAQGPIHRIEIEAFQAVPSHLGHPVKKFAATVHRTAPAGLSYAPPPQSSTHVFEAPANLADFLREELSKDCER